MAIWLMRWCQVELDAASPEVVASRNGCWSTLSHHVGNQRRGSIESSLLTYDASWPCTKIACVLHKTVFLCKYGLKVAWGGRRFALELPLRRRVAFTDTLSLALFVSQRFL
jgi:hypothetical protein